MNFSALQDSFGGILSKQLLAFGLGLAISCINVAFVYTFCRSPQLQQEARWGRRPRPLWPLTSNLRPVASAGTCSTSTWWSTTWSCCGCHWWWCSSTTTSSCPWSPAARCWSSAWSSTSNYWLNESLTHCLFCSIAFWASDFLTLLLPDSLTNFRIVSLNRWLSDSLTPWLIVSFALWLSDSLILSPHRLIG